MKGGLNSALRVSDLETPKNDVSLREKLYLPCHKASKQASKQAQPYMKNLQVKEANERDKTSLGVYLFVHGDSSRWK